ncbi:terminase large subunit [Mycobacterium intracellulare]|uniref:terminase large subunit n=1 Tax=Mycobacterium intracellulare TaxID=1767 RepID=UPI00109E8890|nr:terminase TerL endonuclease subunit [Mycobacterium intracellulare]
MAASTAGPKRTSFELCGWINPVTGEECAERGDHFCVPRADHVCGFFEDLLMHTKGTQFRKRFLLRDWQRDEILRPLFGRVVWSQEHRTYVRRYRIAYIEMARKNGKSQILAGIMLYLLFSDGEQSAELISVAKDREQASAVFNVASQMVLLQPVLSKAAKVVPSTKRIVKPGSNSVYMVKAADGGRLLGGNPSGVAADEILAWPTPSGAEVWNALRSGMGSLDRRQPLMVAATTAPAADESFGAELHRRMVRVIEDPEREPHVFAWIRNLPLDADIYDERNWAVPNPALGDFLSLEEMRLMAVEARNDPIAELAFRRFQMNQTLGSEVHWMPMHLWDECAGTIFGDAQAALDAFAGRECWMGIDLAGRQDLTSVCYIFPAEDSVDAVWRHWMPREAYERLNRANGGILAKFVEDGWLTVTEGNVLDFNAVYDAIESDGQRFTVLGIDADRWSSDPVLQEIGSRVYVHEDNVMAYTNDFQHMSDSMHRLFEMVKERKFRHHGNPLARWCFDCCEARLHTQDPDLIMPAKIKRDQSNNRIDAVPAAIMALKAWWERGRDVYSAYEKDGLLII